MRAARHNWARASPTHNSMARRLGSAPNRRILDHPVKHVGCHPLCRKGLRIPGVGVNQMTLWEEFLAERRILRNLAPLSLRFYEACGREFAAILPLPTKAGILSSIEAMKGRGLRTGSINGRLRGLRAYCHWLASEGQAPLVKVPMLKAELRLLPVLSEAQMAALRTYRPVGAVQTRCHVAALICLDTGLRCAEILGLELEGIDWDSSTLRVLRKGRRESLVPLSSEGRRILWKWCRHRTEGLVFGTRTGLPWSPRNFERGLRQLGEQLGLAAFIRTFSGTRSPAIGFAKAGMFTSSPGSLITHR
jgi:site-specific recombinase XerD